MVKAATPASGQGDLVEALDLLDDAHDLTIIMRNVAASSPEEGKRFVALLNCIAEKIELAQSEINVARGDLAQ